MADTSAKKAKLDDKKSKDKKEEKKDEMTEEDKKLEDDLNLLVQRLGEPDHTLYKPSLDAMRNLIRASTTSMTSVPKPLKFMRPHYTTMKSIHETIADGDVKKECADLISVLAMTSDEPIDCIKYRLVGSQEPIGDWGHEYVRHLAMELSEEWKRTADGTEDNKKTREQLIILARHIITHHMKHNAEVEACDLLIEMEKLELLAEYVDEADHQRVCLYLLSCAPLTPDPDNIILIRTAKDLHLKFGKFLEAVRCAIMLNDPAEIKRIVMLTQDPQLQMQMAILLGRHQIFLDFDGIGENSEKLSSLNCNTSLSEYFHSLGRELDIMEPKTPEGIYKSHLEATRPFGSSSAPDSARMNLAGAFVNGFVNCGFSVDKMMAEQEDANRWFYKNKDMGMFSAAASQGLVWRWDIDSGLTHADRFLYVNDDNVKAGTLLGIGIISSGIQDPCDPASAILLDHVHSDRSVMRIGSILGLGLAYANSKRETVTKNEEGGVIFELKKILSEKQSASCNAEVRGLAGLALGLILVGTADHSVAMDLYQVLASLSDIELADPNTRFLALGIALIFLGTQDKAEVMVESVRCLGEPFGSMASTLVDVCAFAGTGNVLKIQKLLHICSEHYETKEEKKSKSKVKFAKETAAGAPVPRRSNPSTSGTPARSTTATTPAPAPLVPTTPVTPSTAANLVVNTGRTEPIRVKTEKKKDDGKLDLSSQQAVAVLGIGLIAMGDEIGSQMALRMFGHLIRYGEPVIRRAVPLAMALLSVSNPQLSMLETLSKFSHDADPSTAHSSIFALGLVGAGTNNARLVAMLRSLASFHHKEQVALMLVRMAQGLTHLAKGTMTLNPWHSDRQMLCPSALAGLLTVCFSFLDANNSILNNRQHYLLYCLVPAMQPRMLVTLVEDEKKQLKQVNVTVRVGQAVDVVAQAGRPKTITGFQTHKTPVLLAYGERAELASEEYLSLTPYLEGLVILKKNPNYEAPTVIAKPKA